MTFTKKNILDIDTDNIDRKIYRIFSIERFKQLMCSEELVLVNPSKWDDPFENFFLKGNATDESGKLFSLKTISNSWYGQCWTYTEESDALWRIYSPNKDGVRVSTTIQKLFSCFWDQEDQYAGLKYFIGQVSYHDRHFIESLMSKFTFTGLAMGGQNDNFARLLCIKRKEFEHEDEVRILVNDIDHNIGKDGCYKQPFDYTKVFDSICLDPRLDADDYEKIKGEFISMGCRISISQSELYKVSFSPIRLQ